MNCKQCGNTTNQGDQFCTNCGTAITEPTQNQQQITPAPQQVVSEPIVSQPTEPITQTPIVNNMPTAQPMAQPTPPQPTPVAPQPVFTQPMSNQVTPPVKNNKKLMILLAIIASATLVIGCIIFSVFFFSGSAVFARDSIELSGDGYSLRMPKGWQAERGIYSIDLTENDDQARASVYKSDITFDEARSSAEEFIKAVKLAGGSSKVTSETSSTYAVSGNVDVENEKYKYSVYTQRNEDQKASSMLIALSRDGEILDKVASNSKYILDSAEIDSTSSRSLNSGFEYETGSLDNLLDSNYF